MKLTVKINLLALAILIVVTVAMGTAGVLAITNLVEDMNRKLLHAELARIMDKVRDAQLVLQESGVAGVASYVERAQQDLVHFFQAHQQDLIGDLIVVSLPDTIVFHETLEPGQRIDLDRLTEMAQTGRGLVKTSLLGEEHLLFYDTFPDWNWLTILSVPFQELVRDRDTFLRNVAVIMLSGLGVGFLAFFWFAKGIVKPVQQLAYAAAGISRGEWDRKLPVSSSSDEVGDLARSFGKMADNLSAAHLDLENQARALKDSNLKLNAEIEERRAIEEALRQSEKKYRSIFENAAEGIVQATVDGKLLSVNPAVVQMLGYDSPQDIKEAVHDLRTDLYARPEKRDEFLTILNSQGEVTDFEVEFVRKDKSTLWCSLHSKPYFDSDGSILYIDTIIQNIAARKKAEEEKEHLEEQLRQAQKMEAIGKLSGGISHDFNNLLQAISGYLYLLRSSKSDQDPDQAYLEKIQLATARATDIVKRLLTFSRKVEARKTIIDMNKLVSETIDILEHTIPKMISLTTDFSSGIQGILADPLQIEQLFMNLANNAVDAMPEGGTLHVSTADVTLGEDFVAQYPEVEPGRYVRLTVGDTGHGMDESTLDRIFEPFYTTREVGKGTGLGLSIVYGIVKSHNGHITCSSAPGRGATFNVYFPSHDAGVAVETQKEKPPTTATGKGVETILIVDDEDMILDIAEEFFHAHGYRVMKATSGEEALEVYGAWSNEIDMVLMDLGMPGMGGEKCLQELLLRDPEAKIIVASGYSVHTIAKNPQQYGAAAFVTKPYPLEDMLLTIRSILDRD